MTRSTALTTRFLRRAVLAAAALIVVGAILSYLCVNRWLRRTVERQTTQSIRLRTTVDSVTMSIFGGGLHLEQFQIASPEGFSGEPLLVLGEADMDVSYVNLRREPVRIRSITFTRPRLLIETVNGTMNIRRMIDELPPPTGRPLRLVIDEVTVKDATVILRPGMAGLPAEISVQAPAFTLHHLGSGDGAADSPDDGATIPQVVTQLVMALAANAGDAPNVPPELRDVLKDPMKAILAELGARARRQILRAVPASMSKMLTGLLDPATAKTESRLLGGLIGIPAPATRPATRPGPADRGE